ncbi:MAG: hypothetical protein EOP54_04195 [Sphingobacteriales bacterium]|nr:MAG: hypothetical protein EOP54_04195 [Sphingobacteriales bacterium]
MKIGFILECGPQGADLKVCKNLVGRIRPADEFVAITLDNKPKLISGCGEAAKQLIKSGIETIYIIWDLFPDWRDDRTRPCMKEDRDNVFNSLNAAQVPLDRVHLVCIEQELESWLIADGRAISTFLSRPTHHVKIKDSKSPDTVQNPKKYLTKHFSQNGKGLYTDYMHAEKLVALIPDFQKLKRSETFKRFYFKLTGTQLT